MRAILPSLLASILCSSTLSECAIGLVVDSGGVDVTVSSAASTLNVRKEDSAEGPKSTMSLEVNFNESEPYLYRGVANHIEVFTGQGAAATLKATANAIASQTSGNISLNTTVSATGPTTPNGLGASFHLDVFAEVNITTHFGGILTMKRNSEPEDERWLSAESTENISLSGPRTVSAEVGDSNTSNDAIHWTFQEDTPKKIFNDATLIKPIEGGQTARIGFVPKNSMQEIVSVTKLAEALGYKRFDFVQYVTHDPNPIKNADGKTQKVVYVDPPLGGFMLGTVPVPQDQLPYYYDTFNPPNEYLIGLISEGFFMEDAPYDRTIDHSNPSDYMEFYTLLVGVPEFGPFQTFKNKVVRWRTNFDGKSGGISLAARKNPFFVPSIEGRGGILTADVIDFSEIPQSVLDRIIADGGALPVPEPTSSSLVLVFICALLTRGRKR